jgi:phosphatidylethanolamine-binding protein (PEBP) family uncharacterized protein
MPMRGQTFPLATRHAVGARSSGPIATVLAVRTSLCVVALGAWLMAAGCGSGNSSSASSAKTTSIATTAKQQSVAAPPPTTINASLAVPLHGEENLMPSTYTCDGRDLSVPVVWSRMPAHTAGIALFGLSLRPVHGQLFFNWAVIGLGPRLRGLPAGRVPAGAVMGRNSSGTVGYTFCPPRGPKVEHLVIRVIALRRPIRASPGFDAAKVYEEAEQQALAVGLTGGGYLRR